MIEHIRQQLRPVFEGRRFILIGGPIVGQIPLAQQLRSVGAERPFLLGAGLGTGPKPDLDPAEWRVIHTRPRDMIHAFWEYEAALAELPDEVVQAIDAWDPDGSARVAGPIVMSDVRQVAGRTRYARRRPEWAALEDKTRSPAFLDSIGVRRGALAIVNARGRCLRAAAARLDSGAGTVWAGDTRDGVNGGAAYVRWVRDDESEREAQAFFEASCDRVRVMPFVEGVPCSVHGIVFPEGVAVFKPMELLTLRRPGSGGFVYAGSASYWDPAPADAEAIRATGRRIGQGLQEQVRYRGAYTVDGVLGEDGFIPTEINTRIGGAIRHNVDHLPELPFQALVFAVAEGETLDYRPDELEAFVLERAEARRSGGPRMVVDRTWTETRTLHVIEDADGFRSTDDENAADGALYGGPNEAGGFVGYGPKPEKIAVGPSYGPAAVRALAAADALLEAGIGPLDAARVVR